MDQQITQFHIGVAHVGTKHIRTEEIIKLPSCGMLFKKLAVLMARAGERAVLHLDVLVQRVEKRRQQGFFITCRCGFQFKKRLGFTVNHAGNRLQFQRRLAQHEYRQVKPGAFKQRQNATARIGNGKHHGGDISKVSIIQGHHFAMGGKHADNIVTGCDF